MKFKRAYFLCLVTLGISACVSQTARESASEKAIGEVPTEDNPFGFQWEQVRAPSPWPATPQTVKHDSAIALEIAGLTCARKGSENVLEQRDQLTQALIAAGLSLDIGTRIDNIWAQDCLHASAFQLVVYRPVWRLFEGYGNAVQTAFNASIAEFWSTLTAALDGAAWDTAPTHLSCHIGEVRSEFLQLTRQTLDRGRLITIGPTRITDMSQTTTALLALDSDDQVARFRNPAAWGPVYRRAMVQLLSDAGIRPAGNIEH